MLLVLPMKHSTAISLTLTTEAVSKAGLGNEQVSLLSILALTGRH